MICRLQVDIDSPVLVIHIHLGMDILSRLPSQWCDENLPGKMLQTEGVP